MKNNLLAWTANLIIKLHWQSEADREISKFHDSRALLFVFYRSQSQPPMEQCPFGLVRALPLFRRYSFKYCLVFCLDTVANQSPNWPLVKLTTVYGRERERWFEHLFGVNASNSQRGWGLVTVSCTAGYWRQCSRHIPSLSLSLGLRLEVTFFTFRLA